MQVSDLFRFKNREIKALHLTWIAFFICFYVWFNMAPLASSMLKTVGWLTKDDIRLFAIANVALTIPARIIVGMALDRFGPRRVFSILMVLMAVPTLFFALGDTKEQLFVSRLILSSVGASFVVGIHMTALWFKPRDIGFAEGFYAGWGNFGSAAAAMTLPTIALTMFGGPEGWRYAVALSGVVMGYRSSMPIIELKLTGPAEQREAMLAIWPEVKKVAGESMIFEGTEGLPAQIARCLQARQLSLTLSEQFTGGLLALQLSRASVPLLASEVVPCQEESLAQSARWAAERRVNHFAGLALAVSGQEADHLNFVLSTPEGTHALRVKFSATRYSLTVRQQVCAMMALNMLRRWLNGQPVAGEHGWINVVDS